jgi:ABC-2 type transport system ATP-binding protein
MEEAQRLADRVAIIRSGEIVGLGRPDEIGDRSAQPAVVTFRIADEAAARALEEELAGRSNGSLRAAGADARGLSGGFRLHAEDATRLLHELTSWAVERGVELDGLEVRRPSLEDVYLRLTGQQEAATPEPAPGGRS